MDSFLPFIVVMIWHVVAVAFGEVVYALRVVSKAKYFMRGDILLN